MLLIPLSSLRPFVGVVIVISLSGPRSTFYPAQSYVWLTPLLRPAGGYICPGSIYAGAQTPVQNARQRRRRTVRPTSYVTRSKRWHLFTKADLAFAAFGQLLLRRNPVVYMKAARLTLPLPHFVSTPANALLSFQMPRQFIIFGG